MLKVSIETKNDAFKVNLEYELNRCLDGIKENIRKGWNNCPVYDSNGNRVGFFKLTNWK